MIDRKITEYINRMQSGESFGHIVPGISSNDIHELPYFQYDKLARDFPILISEILKTESLEKEQLIDFFDITFACCPIDNIDISVLDKMETLSLLTAILKIDSAEEGILYSLYTSGKLLKALNNLVKNESNYT